MKRDSEKSTESGGRPLRVEEAARVERLWTVREMATREQVQEALPQLQAQGARVAALETQLQIEQTKATTAEQERSALIQTLVTTLSKGSRKGKGKRYKGQNHMSNVKCWNCGKSEHFWRDCREMWWSEEKATGKGRINSAESSNWEEGRLGGRSQSYREQDEKWTDSLELGERFYTKEAK